MTDKQIDTLKWWVLNNKNIYHFSLDKTPKKIFSIGPVGLKGQEYAYLEDGAGYVSLCAAKISEFGTINKFVD